MYRPLLSLLLVVSIIHGNESHDGPPLMWPESAEDQLEALQRNVTSLWTYIYELRGAVTHHLNHLRQHQVEMENAIHRLEHHGEGHGDSHSAASAAGHSHSGEDHSHGSSHHSHSGENHHHSGENHHHSGEHHSHSGEHHSHGGDEHSHAGDGHSNSGEHPSHGHHHDSHSHSHTDGDHAAGHEDHHAPRDTHENADDLQQTVQVSEPLAEPVIVPTTRRSHAHHHHHSLDSHSHGSSSTPSSSGFEPLNVMGEDSHNHGHHSHGSSSRNRNRTVIMPKYSEYDLYDFAVCTIQRNRAIPLEQQQDIVGQISLWQKKSRGPLNLHVRLSGFSMGDHHDLHQHQHQHQVEDNETPAAPVVHKHGFHIHTLGDLSNGCQSTGPHYNPKGVNHGGPTALVRHVGDLGNIECDDGGNSNLLFSDGVASLNGPYSIIGKSMVIHSGQDDFGLADNEESLKTGNAGVRIACCVIEKVDKLPIRSYRAMKTAIQYQNY